VRGGVAAARVPPGTNGGAVGPPKGDAAGGLNGGTAGGGVNSGNPEVGEGGVAVAEADTRALDSEGARCAALLNGAGSQLS
jgi:hypothetical protein